MYRVTARGLICEEILQMERSSTAAAADSVACSTRSQVFYPTLMLEYQ